jgi:hypothetical protein
MFELQLELHSLASGKRPLISADEMLEVHEMLRDFAGDFKGLLDTQQAK